MDLMFATDEENNNPIADSQLILVKFDIYRKPGGDLNCDFMHMGVTMRGEADGTPYKFFNAGDPITLHTPEYFLDQGAELASWSGDGPVISVSDGSASLAYGALLALLGSDDVGAGVLACIFKDQTTGVEYYAPGYQSYCY